MGEAPGADEDRQGEPFVGQAGQLLTDIIVKGMRLKREAVYILNTLKCRPPGNRTPEPQEAASCREYLDAQLAIIRPEFICCLGAVASQNLLGTTATIGSLRGRVHQFGEIKVICTYHPAYVLRNPPAKRQVWEDIQMLMREMKGKG
jgi:DNA polymerase